MLMESMAERLRYYRGSFSFKWKARGQGPPKRWRFFDCNV